MQTHWFSAHLKGMEEANFGICIFILLKRIWILHFNNSLFLPVQIQSCIYQMQKGFETFHIRLCYNHTLKQFIVTLFTSLSKPLIGFLKGLSCICLHAFTHQFLASTCLQRFVRPSIKAPQMVAIGDSRIPQTCMKES